MDGVTLEVEINLKSSIWVVRNQRRVWGFIQ